jgi:MtfA peptidase
MKWYQRRAYVHSLICTFITLLYSIAATFFWYIGAQAVIQHWYPSQLVYASGILVPITAYGLYYWLNRKYIRRRRLLKKPFPAAWRTILQQRVHYYQALTPAAQKRFEEQIAVFIAEHRLIGVHTDMDDASRVFIAAGAVIPSFGFGDWDYHNVGNILLYPDSFDEQYQIDTHSPIRREGIVGSEFHYNAMILAKPYLHYSFDNPYDGRNSAVHEFVHLLDRADGGMNGSLTLFWNKTEKEAWRHLMGQEMARIANGWTLIDPYASSHPVEFLAVMSEYFFEWPELLANEHPEVYALLKQAYRQDTRQLLQQWPQAPYYYQYKAAILAAQETARIAAEQAQSQAHSGVENQLASPTNDALPPVTPVAYMA